MKVLCFILLSLICSAFASDSLSDQLDPCNLCQSISGYVISLFPTNEITRSELEDALQQVCPALKNIIDTNQCDSFVQTYGSSFVEAVLNAQSSTQNICATIGVCDDSQSGIVYKILVPKFDSSNRIATFEVYESDITSSTFYYKFFTGGIEIEEDGQTILKVSFDSFENTAIYATVVNQDGVGYWLTPIQNGDFVEIEQPLNNSWYYIAVNASLSDWNSQVHGKFHLVVVYEDADMEGNDDDDDDDDDFEEVHHSRIAWITVTLAAPLACLLCCCCCARSLNKRCKKNGEKGWCCKSNKSCNTQTATQTFNVENSTGVEMNQIPQPTMMYYFVPPTAPMAPQTALPYFISPNQVQYAPMQVEVQPEQE